MNPYETLLAVTVLYLGLLYYISLVHLCHVLHAVLLLLFLYLVCFTAN